MNNAALVKDCFSAWEKRDWNSVEHMLADDFRFTSLYDDHLDKREYKLRCWDVVKEIAPYDIVTIMESGNEVFIRYKGQVNGTQVQNTEHFMLSDGKIKEVTVFFGHP